MHGGLTFGANVPNKLQNGCGQISRCVFPLSTTSLIANCSQSPDPVGIGTLGTLREVRPQAV